MMNQSIANQIRRARQNKDLSQDNMADELGITKGAYSKIERGITAISVERLAAIAKVLKMDVDVFFKKSALEDGEPKYGFATKAEVETLAKMIDTMAREVKQLKEIVQEAKKPAKRK